jgi:NAD(P)-dependent dehydrogenase (short-subunit alcohol dehydrogenase family)
MNVFISGGTRGIGGGLVRNFQKLGHKVVYNVCNREDIKAAFDYALKTLGTIDVVINNAGVNQKSLPVAELEEEDISKVIDVNVKGMINATSEALRIMKKQGYGRIYNMEGLGSNNLVFPKTVIYASSKHLLSFFTKGVQKELKAYENIKVGTLSPGMVFTDFLKNSDNFEDNQIMKILGANVDEVTPYLVKKIIKGKMKINYLSTSRMMWKFISYPFKKKK